MKNPSDKKSPIKPSKPDEKKLEILRANLSKKPIITESSTGAAEIPAEAVNATAQNVETKAAEAVNVTAQNVETKAAEAGAEVSKSFAERIKGNFAKEKSLVSKGFRVAGVAAGAALTLDAFRAKDKDGQERGIVGRLAEGGIGLGVAAGSLAMGGR